MRLLFTIIFVIACSSAQAQVKDCGWITIKNVNVLADHALDGYEGHYMTIRPGDDLSWECEGVKFLYLKIEDPAFEAIRDMAVDAYQNNKKARFVIHGNEGIYNGYKKIMAIEI